MKVVNNLVTKSVAWPLLAGVLIGGVSIAALRGGSAGSDGRGPAPLPAVLPVNNLTKENIDLLRELDESFANLAEHVQPSVVHIRADGGVTRDEQNNRLVRMAPEGSGVIFRPDGYIVTNDHVVAGQKNVTVILATGKEYKGKVISASDRQADIAVVKIDAKDLPAARFADSAKVRPGQFAVAIGSPFGLDQTVTVGHVSALGRASEAPDPIAGDRRGYFDLIQTDAPINQGNSGGPLVNIVGEVIGINSTILAAGFGGGSTGIGFAIPSNQARTIADILIEKGELKRGYLGILPAGLKDFQKAELKLDGGALVEAVPNDGPAAVAGIKQGDVIVKIGDVAVRSEQDLRNAMLRYGPGEKVSVDLVRAGERKTVSVSLKSPEPFGANRPQAQANGRPMPDDLENLAPEFRRFFGPNGPRVDQNDAVPPLREGKARLGITVENIDDTNRKQFNIPANAPGVVVKVVEPGSFADRSGIAVGDVITRIDDVKIVKAEDVKKAMASKNWGDPIAMTWTAFAKEGSSMRSLNTTLR
ncbi:MAG: trypsin-like peptidase domain-containing protein [Fimbriimonadaceae bacterium]|nr:trypsin-like peptidase domain-containing protein [Fimbriimonadaceae bacterium]